MTTDMVFYYTSQLTRTEGTQGRLSGEGLPGLEIATPPEFHGPVGHWSPEQLFVGAANACLMTTFLAIAEKSNLAIEDYSSSATGKLEKVEAGTLRTTDEVGLLMTEIVIKPRLTLAHERDRAKAGRIIAKAEEQCLVTRSMKARVVVEPEIIIMAKAERAARM